MNKVYFNANSRHAPAYTCDKPGDMSGYYYQSKDVDDRITELERDVAFQKDNVKALETARDYYVKMLKKLGVPLP